jgi:hypothetical protein
MSKSSFEECLAANIKIEACPLAKLPIAHQSEPIKSIHVRSRKQMLRQMLRHDDPVLLLKWGILSV